MNNIYTNKQKKILFDKINFLSKTEHEEIFKIIKKYNEIHKCNQIHFSKNKNGVFFNLSNLNDIICNEIDNFVNYCIENKKNLDDYDKKINECKINNNYNNIININFDNMHKKDSDYNLEKNEKENWNNIITNTKSIQKIVNYIEKLINDKDKICKKKVNIKFNNAKKKFSKKISNEKKIELEYTTNLEYDNYLIT